MLKGEKNMKLIKKLSTGILAIIMVLAIPCASLFADEGIMLCGAQCVNCGSMTVNMCNETSYSIWMANGEHACCHGKSGYYDPELMRFVYKTTKKCSNCGWSNKQIVSTEWKEGSCYKPA